MEQHGTEDDGYRIAFNAATRTLLVEVWGFWGGPLAEGFANDVLLACRSYGATVMMLDATDLRPQRDEGQAAFARLLSSVGRTGVTSVSVVTANALTKLQLQRIAKESSVRSLVQFTSKVGRVA